MPFRIRRYAPHSHALPKEPIYPASQLASICDVDLKTIHNWCSRTDDLAGSAALESFRTPGGHLRFHHSAVLRFLYRWGYPIPDALLNDRPHVVLVEPDPYTRRTLVSTLGLARPGDIHSAPLPSAPDEDPRSTLGLWATPRYYLYATDDPYRALISLGERAGSGFTPDMMVLGAGPATPDHQALDHTTFIRVTRERTHSLLRFALVTSDTDRQHPPEALADELPSVDIVPRACLNDLGPLLDSLSTPSKKRSTRQRARTHRRDPLAPREPLYVASQIAGIWNIDLKTVHSWVERGDIEAFRTPGRHLRFRRRALLHFLRRYDMAIPADLAPARPVVLLAGMPPTETQRLHTALSSHCEVVIVDDLLAALVEMGLRSAGTNLVDAIVAAFADSHLDTRAWLGALRQHADTRYTHAITVGGTEPDQALWRSLGVKATVAHHDLELIPTVLSHSLGTDI